MLDRRQARRARRPSQRRSRHRDAGERAPRPRARSWRAARVDRRRRASRHRPSARQGDERPDRGGQDRCRPGQPHAPVRRRAPSRRSTSPSCAASRRRRAAASRRRSGATRAIGSGWRSSPAGASRSPSTRSLAAGGGYALLALRPLDRADAPDPRAPRLPRAADRRRPALRRGRGAGRAAPPVPARGAARVRADPSTDARLRAWSGPAADDLAACARRGRASQRRAGRLPEGIGAEVEA